MASNIKANGVDLDDIFKPLGAEPAGPDVGWKVGGIDIAQRYFPSSYPTIDDRPAANTNLQSGGTDLRDKFRSIVYTGAPGPIITTQPVSLVRAEYTAATFFVTATGTGTLTYQWFKGGVAISWATTSNLYLPYVVEGDEGSYYCTVTDSTGMTTSASASLVVNPAPSAPTITTQPVGGTLFVSNVLNVYVVADGTAPLTYQWRKDGTDIPGPEAQFSSYSFTTTAPSDSGSYDCVVTNAYGSVTSSPAVVYVFILGGVAPTITTQPVGGTIAIGNTLNVWVVAAGDPPLSYQWRKDGAIIPGANNASYSYTTTTAANSGSYDCVVTNPSGGVISNPAVVSVVGVPATITSHPVGGELNVGDTLSLEVSAIGNAPMLYQWRKDGINIAAPNSSSYTVAITSPSQAGTYDCVVSNAYGSDTSDPAVIEINVPITPFITVQPVGGEINIGNVLNLFVVAGGAPPLSYQWRVNGFIIPGETGPSYTHYVDSLSYAGSYICVVTNPWGLTTSNPAVVTVNAAGWAPVITTHPVGGSLNIGDVLGLYVVATGVPTLRYQWQKNGVAIEGATNSTYSVPVTSVLQSGGYECVVSNDYGSDLSNTAPISINPPVAPNITGGTILDGPYNFVPGNYANFTVIATGAGLSYAWYKNGSPTGHTTAQGPQFFCSGPSDNGTYAVVVTNAGGSDAASTSLTVFVAPPNITGGTVTGGPYNFVPGDFANFNVNATGAGLSYAWYKNGSPTGHTTAQGPAFTCTGPIDNGTYSVVVTNSAGTDSAATSLVVTLNPPNITGGTVTGGPYNFVPGQVANFTVVATGTSLFYAWYKNGSPTGHTSPQGPLFECTGPSDNGTYSVIVSNPAGSDSASTTLTVS